MGFLKVFSSKISRKKFLASNILFIGGLTFLNKWMPREEPIKTVKLLTKDGRLVEVKANKLPAERKKVSNEQLVSWIWMNNKL